MSKGRALPTRELERAALATPRDGGFKGAFTDALEKWGVEKRRTAAESQWQNVRIERNQAVFKFMMHKAIIGAAIAGELEMFMCAVETSHAKNQTLRLCGHSPNQWSFGKDIELPDEFLARPDLAAAAASRGPDEEFSKRATVRLNAMNAINEYNLSQAVKRAVLSGSRPFRGHFEVGMPVLITRKQKVKKGKVIPADKVSGVIVGHEQPQSDLPRGLTGNLWCQAEGRCILVAPEHLQELPNELPAPHQKLIASR